jgi:hypothetical protein
VAGYVELSEVRAREARLAVSASDFTVIFATVKVVNGAGAAVLASSDGFAIDTSAPRCGTVIDGQAYQMGYLGPSNIPNLIWTGVDQRAAVGELHVAWLNFKDFGSGIAGYTVAVVNSELLAREDFTDADWVQADLGGHALVQVLVTHAKRYATATGTPVLANACRPVSTAICDVCCCVRVSLAQVPWCRLRLRSSG